MRQLVFVILLSPLFTKGQFDNLRLEKGQVFFEKVYSCDSLQQGAVERLLTISIPKIKDVTDFSKSTDIILAKIKNATIDYRKYGGKWATTATILNYPFFGDVSVVWKENKYRVTVTNMNFNSTTLGIITCADFLTKKRATEFGTSKITISAGQYIDHYLTDLFEISNKKASDW